MKHFALTLYLLAASAGAALAADSPFAGTWKLNLEKSQLAGQTLTYGMSDSAITRMTQDELASDVPHDWATAMKNDRSLGEPIGSWGDCGCRLHRYALEVTYDADVTMKIGSSITDQ